MRILIVKKDPSFLEWQLKDILGHAVVAVKTPKEAYTILKEQPHWDTLITGLSFSSVRFCQCVDTGVDVIEQSFDLGAKIDERIIFSTLYEDPHIQAITTKYPGRVRFWNGTDLKGFIDYFKVPAPIVQLKSVPCYSHKVVAVC